MPLLDCFEDENEIRTGIWRISESTDILFAELKLSDEEKSDYLQKNNTEKKREWLSVRLLLHKLSKSKHRLELSKDEFGKPYFNASSKHISLSHSHGHACAMISQKNCGIDLELISSKAGRVLERTMSEEEMKEIDRDNFDKYSTLYWCAKEAIYKAYGMRNLNFRDNIKVKKFEVKEGQLFSLGSIVKDKYHCEFELRAIEFQNYIIVTANEISP